ncbi:hypothetical protein OH807_39795 [Kitasatospora sp. NBC_01560]|uniref:hypothetical protein n=1 Tax=Kitasatospora sp. NBC_01560 TaxID=2975965 RepID=UPI00386E1219
MNSWINLGALWRILAVGLLAGAGLPALFALGLRALNPPVRAGGAPAGPSTGLPASERPTAGLLGRVVAGLCFATVLAAIGWGISVIVHHS